MHSFTALAGGAGAAMDANVVFFGVPIDKVV
jgi:hypothetical protein